MHDESVGKCCCEVRGSFVDAGDGEMDWECGRAAISGHLMFKNGVWHATPFGNQTWLENPLDMETLVGKSSIHDNRCYIDFPQSSIATFYYRRVISSVCSNKNSGQSILAGSGTHPARNWSMMPDGQGI